MFRRALSTQHSFTASHRCTIVHRYCQQFDRLWALGPCDLIDLSRTSRTRTLPQPRAASFRTLDCHRTRLCRRTFHRGVDGVPSKAPNTLCILRQWTPPHPGDLHCSYTSPSPSRLPDQPPGPGQPPGQHPGGCVFCELTASDGSDAPPCSRVIGSSAPPRLCCRLARCRLCVADSDLKPPDSSERCASPRKAANQ